MEQASPEDMDDAGMSDADSNGDESSMKLENSPDTPSSTHHGSSSKPSYSAKSGGHLQKRRRVTRACDECRRKKIKCDGKQPCTHCTVYSYGNYHYAWARINYLLSAFARMFVRSAVPSSPQSRTSICREP